LVQAPSSSIALHVADGVAARLATMPDIPEDFDDMSTEEWTALNKWLRKGCESSV